MASAFTSAPVGGRPVAKLTDTNRKAGGSYRVQAARRATRIVVVAAQGAGRGVSESPPIPLAEWKYNPRARPDLRLGPRHPNPILRGNFGPVLEEVDSRPEVVAGAIPEGFPDGTYIRNGPNPYYEPLNTASGIGGESLHHWFEGDGMLHGVRFEGGECTSYKNRFVATEALAEERAKGKSLWRPIIDADKFAILFNLVSNMVRHSGGPTKHAANTALIQHAGKLLALAEGGPPYEVTADLGTVGPVSFPGIDPRSPFTAHPKVDRVTGELFWIAPSAGAEPFVSFGRLGKRGELLHYGPVEGFDQGTLMHDFAITKQWAVLMNSPLVIDNDALVATGEMPFFDAARESKFGLLRRDGSDPRVRWFSMPSHYTFHVTNAYEDGDEVVVQGCRCPRASMTVKGAELEDFARKEHGMNARLHEWRLNLSTGAVVEVAQGLESLVYEDMPRINDRYQGRRHNVVYTIGYDDPATVKEHDFITACTMVIKRTMEGESKGVQEYRMDQYGPRVYCTEFTFVPRAPVGAEEGAHSWDDLCSTSEDDGWLVGYTHDEARDVSECHIVDARDMTMACRIELKQRIPYGFHGQYVFADRAC